MRYLCNATDIHLSQTLGYFRTENYILSVYKLRHFHSNWGRNCWSNSHHSEWKLNLLTVNIAVNLILKGLEYSLLTYRRQIMTHKDDRRATTYEKK